VEDGPEEYQLYRVFGARRLRDGRIVVVNQGSQQLRFYDATGRFLAQSGGAGGGPGEFTNAFQLWVLPGDTIWVGDYRPWRYLVFGPDGRWLRNVRPEPVYFNAPDVMALLDDGRQVLGERPAALASGPGFQSQSLTVAIHTADGTLQDTVARLDGGRWGQLDDDPQSIVLFPLFESFGRATATGTHILTAHTSQAEYRLLRPEAPFVVDRIVRWTTDDRRITPADIEAEHARTASRYEGLPPGDRRRLLEPLISSDRPVADQFPAFVQLEPSRDGGVWVREYARPTRPDSPAWLRFHPDGRFACRLRTPAFARVLEFGDGYLLALDRDDLGVERVVQYVFR
jgi:hypothetical protein